MERPNLFTRGQIAANTSTASRAFVAAPCVSAGDRAPLYGYVVNLGIISPGLDLGWCRHLRAPCRVAVGANLRYAV